MASMRGGVQRSSGSTCYHPLFVFNLFDDLERCILRPGKVYSADSWRDVLEPVVDRYPGTGPAPLLPRRSRLALAGIYEFLEAEDCLYLGKPDRSGRQDRENERRAHSSRLQTGAHRRPRQLLRATNAIECLHEEFRRRTRTQYLLPNPESACTPCWVLLANGGRGHATPYGRLDQAPRAARHHHA